MKSIQILSADFQKYKKSQKISRKIKQDHFNKNIMQNFKNKSGQINKKLIKKSKETSKKL